MADEKKKLGDINQPDDPTTPEITQQTPVAPTIPQAPPPESVLGTDIPSGQPIPQGKVKQAEHLAQDPHAEAEFRGKQDFHNTLHEFGAKEATNRGDMMRLDPADPRYREKLANLTTQQGNLRELKAHYQQTHPWGQIESAHPGVLGKIGHAFGTIGNIAGNAFVPNLMPSIPGSQANLSAKAEGGAQEQAAGEEAASKAATTAATEAEVPLRQAETAKAEQEETNLENKPDAPANLQQDLANAVREAQEHGIDPAKSPKVQQLQDAITSTQKQTATPEQALDKQYNDAIASGDHGKAERILKVMADVAKAKQAPQRAPQTMVILPGGQAEIARPGMTLPEGTQNIGGFATMNRPTSQMRNVNAQAQIASEGIPPVIEEIGKLKTQLGPVEGRWNEFMQGKVGMENPDMAGLRADLLMVSSAVALAHARGRLPENLREEFDQAINSPKQTADNLIAVLNHIKPWMDRMGTMGNQGSTPAKPPTSTGGGFAAWKASQGGH